MGDLQKILKSGKIVKNHRPEYSAYLFYLFLTYFYLFISEVGHFIYMLIDLRRLLSTV